MKVTAREKTLIIVGIAVAIGVAVFYAATTLLPDGASLSQTVELKKRMLRSQREILLREDFYRNRAEQYRKQLAEDSKRFLPGENPSLAAAELQKVVRDFAQQAGVEITQRNVQQDKKIEDILVKVSIRFDTRCDPEQLVQFLTAIQNYEKLLTVDELNINSIRVSRRFEIRPSLTISGYISAPPEAPAKPAAKVQAMQSGGRRTA